MINLSNNLLTTHKVCHKIGISPSSLVRKLTTQRNINISYVVGFIDAERSFTVYLRQDSKYSQG